MSAAALQWGLETAQIAVLLGIFYRLGSLTVRVDAVERKAERCPYELVEKSPA